MNARERQIAALKAKPLCPRCGRKSTIGDHDCDEPYSVIEARARIAEQTAESVLTAVQEHQAAGGSVHRIRINPATLRRVVDQLSDTKLSAAIDPSQPLSMWGTKIVRDPLLPEDVIGFADDQTRADIIKGMLADAIPDEDGPFKRGPASVYVDGEEIDAKAVSFDFTRDSTDDYRASDVQRHFWERYTDWATGNGSSGNAHGSLTITNP